MRSVKIKSRNNKIEMEFQSQSFLQQQVRSMVGCLKYLGEKKWSLKNFDDELVNDIKDSKKHICFYPFYNIFIDYNGDYLICPHDWGKGELLGNIKEHHAINDIWLSDRTNEVRSKLIESKREVSEACKKCDVPGNFMGLEQAQQWRKLWKT